MNSFWDSSWEKIDMSRVAQYAGQFDLQPDGIIEQLRANHAKTVCDAGCGCGIYALKLASNGFAVSGFDVSAHAVRIARELLEKASVKAELKTASILSTGYAGNQFDGVVSRDVLDHMSRRDAAAAMRELCRIVRPGGVILITLDPLDPEYESEPHTVNADGDFIFTDGKWSGMIFHPYTEQEILEILPPDAACKILIQEDEIIVSLIKQSV